MDIKYQIDSVERQVRTYAAGSGEQTMVTVVRGFEAPVEDVWDACTNPDRLARWFLPVSGELRAGGGYQLEGNAGGTVKECDPPRSFLVSWEFGGEYSEVELRLSAEQTGRTRFELTHYAPMSDHWEQYGPGAAGIGWDQAVAGLTLYLSSGGVEDLADWEGSADHRAFVEGTGLAWGEAHAASGADPSTAQATAARTVAFYTGQG